MSMTTATYQIRGMTCGHCEASVTSEIGKLPGVTLVEVDLEAGTATVTSDSALDVEAVRGAVDEAGYELIR